MFTEEKKIPTIFLTVVLWPHAVQFEMLRYVSKPWMLYWKYAYITHFLHNNTKQYNHFWNNTFNANGCPSYRSSYYDENLSHIWFTVKHESNTPAASWKRETLLHMVSREHKPHCTRVTILPPSSSSSNALTVCPPL